MLDAAASNSSGNDCPLLFGAMAAPPDCAILSSSVSSTSSTSSTSSAASSLLDPIDLSADKRSLGTIDDGTDECAMSLGRLEEEPGNDGGGAVDGVPHAAEPPSSSSDSGSSESEDLDDDDTDIRLVSGVEELDVDSSEFLIKPMSLLPVCPVDDLAVEEEKRRRRCVRMMKKAKRDPRHCPDAESLPSPPSPLMTIPASPSATSRRDANSPRAGTNHAIDSAMLQSRLLRRDSMAIRQKYWKQLGLNMSRQDLERNTGLRRERREGLKVQLNDARSKKGSSKSIFQIISSWYSTSSASDNASDEATQQSESEEGSSTSETTLSPRRKAVRFSEEAELFYIPLHRDYSKRQRDGMWHTRTEFISMVERNLDEVYDEMEREYEEQLQQEAAENAAMAEEEARQRGVEAERVAIEESLVKASASPPPSRAVAGAGSSPSNPPSLALCPVATQVKLTPRARSPHDIRFKYLKHLGIKN